MSSSPIGLSAIRLPRAVARYRDVRATSAALTMTGTRDLNALGFTGKGVTVCIVDSGIDLLHPNFARPRLDAWKDLVDFRSEPYDDSGHGTSMAGLIAANGSLQGPLRRHMFEK